MDESKNVRLELLLRACVKLAKLACGVIRDVQCQREEQGGKLHAELKDPEDPRTYLTVADRRAQRVILAGLRSEFPNLDIVGEEDEAEDGKDGEDGDDVAKSVGEALSMELPGEYVIPGDCASLVLADLCVFVDPVDGTREFVEGRLEACQCLIGVAYRGRPLAGIVGIPFLRLGPQDTASVQGTRTHVLYGVVGSPSQVVGLPLPAPPLDGASQRAGLTLAISSDLGRGTAVEEVLKALDGAQLLVAGASGHKILKVVSGEADAAVLNMKTSLWDTCATEALLCASGGTLTNLLGQPIEHVRTAQPGGYANSLGVLATGISFPLASGRTHDDLTRTVSQQPAVQRLAESVR